MSPENYDRIVQSYIARVSALRDQRLGLLDSDTLQTIAQDLGMTQSDLRAAEDAARACERRGLGYIRHQRWDDAITEFSNAVALNPLDVDVLYHLAVAYKERWTATRQVQDQEESKRLARQCLELDPNHEPSFTLLNQLDQPQTESLQASRSLTTVTAPRPYMGMIFLGAILGLIAFVSLGESFNPNPSAQTANNPHALPKSAAPTPSKVDQILSQSSNLTDVPVRFVETEQAKGVALAVRQSSYDASVYTLAADVQNQSSAEIQELKFKFELLDQAGTVLSTDFYTAIHTSDTALNPGETLGVQWLKDKVAGTQAVRVTVQTVQ